MNWGNKVYPVIIIGGGPSGISCSMHLKKHGLEHIILEKKEMLETWKNQRWDSFYLVTPNWMTNLPGIDSDLPYNNEYMSKKEIYFWLKKYLNFVNPKYLENTRINRLWKEDGLYHLSTNNGIFIAEKIIVATGLFNEPFIPAVSSKINKSINQIHSIEYFNPRQLLNGNTVVVGSGRSGVQIALEIKMETDSDVFLSVGSMTPLPTIYRNVNGVYWLNRLSGYSEGKEILEYKQEDLENDNICNKISQNLFHCESEGVQLAGRLMKADNDFIEFKDNLCSVLEEGAKYLCKVEEQIDNEIIESGLKLPYMQIDFNLKSIDCHKLDPIIKLDIVNHNIKNIVWCTGFRPDYKWIDLDIFDKNGRPELKDGFATKEDVYFCGMGLYPDKSTKSSFGVGLYAFNESAKRAVNSLLKNSE